MKLASCLLRLPALLLALPLAASATIYKWTDEKGITVYSNRAPAAETKVANVQVVMQDDEAAAAPKPIAAPKPNNGNALQERVSALEQQIQALQTQASNSAAPYPAQLPPPTSYYPPPDYYPPSSYYPPPPYPSDYSPPMYGYGYGYGYPYYPYAASYVVVAPGRFGRPVNGFGGHRLGGVRPVPVARAGFGVGSMPVARAGFGVGSMPTSRAMGVAHRR